MKSYTTLFVHPLLSSCGYICNATMLHFSPAVNFGHIGAVSRTQIKSCHALKSKLNGESQICVWDTVPNVESF